MQLSSLIAGLDVEIAGTDDPAISTLALHTKDVTVGTLFAALQGDKVDGRQFIPDALARGASAILTHADTNIETNVPVILAANPREVLAHMAARFYATQPQVVVAVTGTSGKSSTVEFCRQLWQQLDVAGASMGTIGIHTPTRQTSASLTTADVISVQQTLAEVAAEGVTRLALEASSHGLHQYRLDGVKLAAAAFTNLSPEHMDYHADMEDYFNAKAQLFSRVVPDGCPAVLNADSPYFEPLQQICEQRGLPVYVFGYASGSTLHLADRQDTAVGQRLRVVVGGEDFTINLPLPGEFQALNALTAAALVMAAEQRPAAEVLPLLETLQTVPGRLELAGVHPNGARVFNDYAHKPEALEKVLTNLRAMTAGKLWVVFGCGGDRDRVKRPKMGAIAARLADRVIVTDDNPRTEDPALIRQAILEAAPDAEEIGDRCSAIAHAVENLQPDDVLVVAGKGHETGQTIGDKVIPHDDTTVIQDILNQQK